MTTNQKNIFKIIILLIPVFLIHYYWELRFFDYPKYEILWLEDWLWEKLQFFLLIFSSILSLWLSYKFFVRKNRISSFIFLICAIILFFIWWEEISRGQRFFKFNTPQILSTINKQNETNIHNVGFIHNNIYIAYRLIAIFWFCGWIILLILPFSPKTKYLLNFFIPYWYLSLYYIPLIINFLEFWKFSPQDYELAELILYLSVSIFLLINFQKVTFSRKEMNIL